MKMLWFSVFSFLFFSLEPTVTKDIWMRATSFTVMIIFRECHSERYLITAIFIVRSQQLRATLTAAFWMTPDSWRFYGRGSTYVLIFLGETIMKWISTKMPTKLSAVQTIFHQYRWWHFTYFCMLLFLSNNIYDNKPFFCK